MIIIYKIPNDVADRAILTKYRVSTVTLLPNLLKLLSENYPGATLHVCTGFRPRQDGFSAGVTDYKRTYIIFKTREDLCAFTLAHSARICEWE